MVKRNNAVKAFKMFLNERKVNSNHQYLLLEGESRGFLGVLNTFGSISELSN